jgi:hypothetical protein
MRNEGPHPVLRPPIFIFRYPRSVFTLIYKSPVPGNPLSIPIIMPTNPYPVVIWRRRRSAVICRRRSRRIVVRSAGRTERGGHNGRGGSDYRPCHGKWKQQRVAVIALFSIGVNRRESHEKSQADGCRYNNLFRVHSMPPDVRSMMLVSFFDD